MISHTIRPVDRRGLLGFSATAFVAAIPLRLARAQAGDASATAPVEQLIDPAAIILDHAA